MNLKPISKYLKNGCCKWSPCNNNLPKIRGEILKDCQDCIVSKFRLAVLSVKSRRRKGLGCIWAYFDNSDILSDWTLFCLQVFSKSVWQQVDSFWAATKCFEQQKVEKIFFICKMCLNLNCNRKVFENGVQSESVMGVNVWKGSDSVQMKLSTIFCMYIGWINKCCIYSRCQLSQYIYKYRQPCCLTQCEWGFAHVLYCANIASGWHRSSSGK